MSDSFGVPSSVAVIVTAPEVVTPSSGVQVTSPVVELIAIPIGAFAIVHVIVPFSTSVAVGV